MRFVHSAIAIFFVIFIFLGNAGLRVFKHACEEDGIFTSYIIPMEDHCSDHAREDLPVCCQETQKEKDDCCSDEVSIYQVDFDFFQDYELAFNLIFLPNDSPRIVWADHVITSTNREPFMLRPPPKYRIGRELLILNQVFRI